jgi:hypothetical protein
MSELTEKSRPTSNFAELSRSECEKLLAEHSVGWVGPGRSKRTADPARHLRLPRQDRNLFIAITPDSITGRSVRAPFAD